jgi:hypothetical protein
MSRMTAAQREDRLNAMVAAAWSGGDSDRVLSDLLADPQLDLFDQVVVTAELGKTRGAEGSAAIRRTFGSAMARLPGASKGTRSFVRDLICASVAALAKRDGPEATDVYLAAIASDNAAVRDYGMSALAAVGDDRGWEQVWTRLAEILRRQVDPASMRWAEAAYAMQYLARHAEQGSARAIRLIALLRDRWRHVADPHLIEYWWPGVGPGGDPRKTWMSPECTPPGHGGNSHAPRLARCSQCVRNRGETPGMPLTAVSAPCRRSQQSAMHIC